MQHQHKRRRVRGLHAKNAHIGGRNNVDWMFRKLVELLRRIARSFNLMSDGNFDQQQAVSEVRQTNHKSDDVYEVLSLQ
jgi:hypothetical protein